MFSSSPRFPDWLPPQAPAASPPEAGAPREQWFQSLVENACDALALLAADGTLLYASPALCPLLDASLEAILGSDAFAWIHPDDRDRCRELFQLEVERRDSGEPLSTPYRVRTASGAWRWLESTTVNRLDDPTIRGIIVSTRDVTERIRLTARNQTFLKLGQQLNRTTTPEDAGRVILAAADELLGWDACWLELHDPEGGPAHVVLLYDEIDGERRSLPTPQRHQQQQRMVPLTERAIREGATLILRTPGEVSGWSCPFGDISRPSASILCVPIRGGSEFVGAISIQSYRFNAYTQEDTATLQALAEYCAGALHRTRAEAARRELQEQLVHAQQQEAEALREQARLATVREELGTTLAQDAELATTLHAALQPLVRHLPLALAQVWTLDPDAEQLRWEAGAGLAPPAGARRSVPVGETELGALAANRRPLLDNAMRESPRHAEWAREQNLTAMAGYPLVTEGRVVGALVVFAREPIAPGVYEALGGVAERLAQHLAAHRARQAFDEMQTRFAAFMDHSPALAVMRDAAGRFVYVNRQFEETHGLAAHEVLGKRLEDIFPPEPAAQFLANQMEMLRHDRPQEFIETLTLPDGRVRDFHAVKFPIRDPQGRRYVGVISTDVTEQRRLEQQLHQAQKMEAVGRLAGGVAHDFNNLLFVINGYTQLLLAGPDLTPACRDSLSEVLQAGERAAALTSQLLAFSRRQLIQPQRLDLGTVVTDITRLLHRLIGEDVELLICTTPGAGPIEADRHQLEQVLINLVVNARDAMPDGGRLTLDVRGLHLAGRRTRDGDFLPPGAYVCLSVRDTGCGMEPETLEHIFEPFYTTKPQGKGTGLGLATVYGIVEQSRGHIEVETELNAGTCFRLYFPCCEEEPQ